MLIRMADGKTAFLDFREAAPGKARATCTSGQTEIPHATVLSDGGLRGAGIGSGF